MEYRIITNGELYRVQRRRGRWWPWMTLKWPNHGFMWVRELSYAEACEALHKWEMEDERKLRLARHGWKEHKPEMKEIGERLAYMVRRHNPDLQDCVIVVIIHDRGALIDDFESTSYTKEAGRRIVRLRYDFREQLYPHMNKAPWDLRDEVLLQLASPAEALRAIVREAQAKAQREDQP